VGSKDPAKKKSEPELFDLTAGDDEPRSAEPHRQKEADRVNTGPWPANVPAYTNWRLNLVDEVVSESSRPDDAFAWISAVKGTANHDDLQRANYPFSKPIGFETLDAKLASALSRIISGDFGRRAHVIKITAMETGKRLSGRQLLHAIDEHFRLTEADGAVFGMEHLLSVTMKHDSLERVIADWDTVLTGMRKRPEESVLEALFVRRLKLCSLMKDDMRDYERLVMDDALRCYAELYRTANRAIERRRLQQHRDAMTRHIAGGNASAAAAVKGTRAGREALPKGKGRGQGKGPSNASGGDSLAGVCRFHLKGKRKAGDSCPLKHNRMCRYRGTPEGCRMGDRCPFPHTKQASTAHRRGRSHSRGRSASQPAPPQAQHSPVEDHSGGKGRGKGKKGKGKGRGKGGPATPAAASFFGLE